MDEYGDYRRIPGYENYAVDRNGSIISIERMKQLGQWLLNGYRIVDTFRGSKTETLPVHRAVALAWVENPDPERKTCVNHKDGNPLNNWYENLEWATISENNYHAVNTGLRSDNIPCKIRDFYTGEVIWFASFAQAASFMGVAIGSLRPASFGFLIAKRFEFRCADDPKPWFYESKNKVIRPTRYMVIVKYPDNREEEYFSVRDLLKKFQLYKSPSKSMAGLVEFGNKMFPDLEFVLKDSLAEIPFKVDRGIKRPPPIRITAKFKREDGDDDVLNFNSLTSCSAFFKVDRSSIQNRLNNEKTLCGWTFTN